MLLEARSFHWSKDKNSKFTSCCELLAELAGGDSPHSVVGKTSHELIWRDKADIFLAEDKIALTGRSYQGFQTARSKYGEISFFVTKNPFYDSFGNIIGKIGSSINVSYLNSLNRQLAGHTGLTSKELRTLRYVTLGYTAKQIADKLSRSPRTIETHIENLKIKLGSNNKSELIETAVKLGLIKLSFCC